MTTTGFPPAVISVAGVLPPGVKFADPNGTATLSGTPLSGGVFPLTFTATNSAGTTTQDFTLTVQGLGFTSAQGATFFVGESDTFTVTTAGTGTGVPPASSITLSGALSAGVTFMDNGDGTATLSGTPAAHGESRSDPAAQMLATGRAATPKVRHKYAAAIFVSTFSSARCRRLRPQSTLIEQVQFLVITTTEII